MRTWRAGVLPFLLIACVQDTGVGGRWQGEGEPGSAMPVFVAFTLRVDGDSLRGWGVARTDGRSFPISVRGITSERSRAVTLLLAPWRYGVVDIESAQLSGSLGARGEIVATVRTDAGTGEGPVTRITLKRPAR